MGNAGTAAEPSPVETNEEQQGQSENKELARSLLVQKVGYRVLGVQAQSPSSYCGLVSFFDFIVAANGIPLKTLDTTFISIIKASEDKPLTLTVYNYKNHSVRDVVMVPSRRWPGEGMLGATIRFDTFEDAEEQLIHVLEVEENSPAEIAGLQPGEDYLLGTAEKTFKDSDVLFQELKQNLDRPVEFYVYNSISDEVRVVVIMPTEDWGGEGILGASVAHGFLHKLPQSSCKTLGRSPELNSNPAVNSPFGVNASPMLSSTLATAAGQAAAPFPPIQQATLDSLPHPHHQTTGHHGAPITNGDNVPENFDAESGALLASSIADSVSITN